MTTTKIPKARVRLAIWVDGQTERYRALVLVAGGKNFMVGGTSVDIVDYAIEHQLDREYGDNWEFVGAVRLGRLDHDPDRFEVARLMEEAS